MNKKKLGILLITIGIFLFLNSFDLISNHVFLYLLGAGFLASYLMLGARKHYRNIGFLIPASILIAIALFSDLQRISFINNLGGGIYFILLGFSFLVILIHSSAFREWDWPIYPGSILIIFGLLIVLIDNSNFINKIKYLNYIIPLVIIAVGIFFLNQSRKK